ncbi:CYTH and CHAD domain-containing protein [Streptomyces sp. IBSBF 2435]|uniref:CYTH and CHAD domain-containing protein n=1 Tax=Streptomyces sp. IBSBF 2435 TaxID=2903531 RepID=UPI002FDC0560
MSTNVLEQEVTFEGSGVFDPAGLARLPEVARVREVAPEDLDALYYDTADLSLLAHGCTLRRRSGGHDAGWHLKLPAEGSGRREFHAPLRAGKRGKVPGELSRRIKAYARGRDLLPVARLRTRRRRHLLLDKRDRPLAEIAQDQVDAQLLGVERLGAAPGTDAAAKGTSTRLLRWSEIEIELERGDPGLLRAATRWMTDAGHHLARPASKLDHALTAGLGSAAMPGRPAALPRAGTAGEAVMRRLGEQVDLLLSLDGAVRADEPDAVHRMRSTSRRLRNLLRGNGRVLDRERTDPVAAELRRLTRVLGGSRDHEVLAGRLAAQARTLDPPARAGLAARVRDQEKALHRQAHRRAVTALDRARHRALLDALDALRTDPPLRAATADLPAVRQLGRAAARDQKRTAARMKRAMKAAPGRKRDEALHSARKAVRRARHTAETALPYGGRTAERLRKRTKAVQQVLGDHQDAVMARAALPKLAAVAAADGVDTFDYGRLYALQDTAAATALRDLPAAWRKSRAPKLTAFG